MDPGLTVRPVNSVPTAADMRAEPVPVRQAVPTELAPSQSVTATSETTTTRNDAMHPAARSAQATSHEVVVDQATHQVVYRVVDKLSGQVISQVPDSVELQLAAYTRAVQRAVENGKSPTDAQVQAELDLQV